MPLILLAPVTLALLQAAPAAAPPSPTPVVAPAPTPAAAPPASAPPASSAPSASSPAVVSTPVAAPGEPAPGAPPTSWYMPNAAPVPTTAVPAGEGPDDTASFDANKYRRLVFSNFYTLNFGIFPVPSGDFSFFLGTNLRPRKSYLGQDWNTALGYQLTLSVGGADVLYGSSDAVQSQFGDSFIGPLFYHRHALMAQGLGGRKGRFYYAMGGGAVMWNTLLVGIEGEAKLGYAFSAKQGKRLKGIFGGQVRLGGPFDLFPLPQFGLFIGFMVF